MDLGKKDRAPDEINITRSGALLIAMHTACTWYWNKMLKNTTCDDRASVYRYVEILFSSPFGPLVVRARVDNKNNYTTR
jgi:hypothetical protein